MKLSASYFSLLFLALAAGCDNSAAPEPGMGPLTGSWIAAPEAASPSGRYERTLTFRGDGTFSSEFRSYGIYSGQNADDLSSYSRTEGTFGIEIEGDGLIFRPVRIVSWDRFNGANSPETVRDAHPGEEIFDDARYAIEGEMLTLRYTIYPADAAEPALLVFARAD